MNPGSDILRYFEESTSPEERQRIEASLPESERKDFEVMRAIWEQSGKLANSGAFDRDAAWSRLDKRLTVSDVREAAKSGAVGGESKKRMLVVPMRVVYAAAAILIVLVIGTRFLISGNDASEPITFTSYDKARIYAYESLFDIAEELMALAQDAQFEQYTYSMAGERFDSETNVLIKDLLGEKSKTRKWKNALGKFRNIDGFNYYPQVYLFDYENYIRKKTDPVVVFYITDDLPPEGEYVYDAYKYVDGQLKFYRRIDEQQALREKVWVFSLNENVDSEGKLPNFEIGNTPGSAGTVSVNSDLSNGRLDKLGIYDHKESWAGGASEVYVRRYLNTWNGLNNEGEVTGFDPQTENARMRGMRVRSFLRSEVMGRQVFEVDFVLSSNWDTDEFHKDPVVLTFVLYEHDVWPNGINTDAYRLANGEQRFLSYSSAQECFDIARVFGTPSPEGWNTAEYPYGIPDTHLIDNFVERTDPDIFYNTERY